MVEANRGVQPIKPAATVILVRAAKPHFEILMLKRTSKAAFAGGMYVFPGGRVDPDDHLQVYHQASTGPGSAQQRQMQAVGRDYLGYWIAAVRECFEEAGILLAYSSSGQLVTHEHPEIADFRDALNAGRMSLEEICRQGQLTLALDRIHFFNRWVTPRGRPRRFDTRFFIARAPDAQSDSHDDVETVDSVWISAQQAIEKNAAGEFQLMGVTERQLRALAQFDSADAVVAASESQTDFPIHRPELPPHDADAGTR